MRCLTVDECQRWRSEHCRRLEWKHQTTCITPLKRLPWYSTVLVEQLQPFDHAKASEPLSKAAEKRTFTFVANRNCELPHDWWALGAISLGPPRTARG